MLPKVRSFIWKLLSRAIAVKEGLVRRGLQVANTCPICTEPESIEHLILDCQWARRVWEQLLNLLDVRDGCSSVNQWLGKRLADQTGSREGNETRWQLVLVDCWSIWKSRCLQAFEGKAPVPSLVVKSIRTAVQEFRSLNTPSTGLHLRSIQSQQGRQGSRTDRGQQPARVVELVQAQDQAAYPAGWRQDRVPHGGQLGSIADPLHGRHEAGSSTDRAMEVWRRPEPGWIKVNVDAAWSHVEGKGGIWCHCPGL